jgi:hypothetical protein
MNRSAILDQLQCLLARLVDVPVHYPVSGFHFAERAHCSALLGRQLGPDEDEQVLICETAAGPALSVYIDQQVVNRLDAHDPLLQLNDSNLADFCVALEGISHFQYLAWSAEHERSVSLLELELQAEVDKYAVAVYLLRRQGCRDLPRGLRRRLFNDIRFITGLPAEIHHRYVEANRHAAGFCQRLEQRFLSSQRFRPESWLRALRDFYRCAHRQKLRCALP